MHVARTGEKRNIYWFWWEKLNHKGILGNTVVDGRIILKWILKK
jgi:hypothetical protein